MFKFLGGVAVGILGAILALHFYGGSSTGTTPPAQIAPGPGSNSEAVPTPSITAPEPATTEQPPARTSNNQTAEGPSAQVVNQTLVADSDLVDSATEEQTQARSSVDLPAEPVPFPEKHRELIEKAEPREPRSPPVGAADLHQRLESEPRDLSWSHYIEEQLKSYFYAAAEPKGIQVIAIECRSTLCEVQGLTHADTAGQWMIILEGMRQQPWWAEFGGISIGSSDVDNETLLLAFLTRRKTEER